MVAVIRRPKLNLRWYNPCTTPAFRLFGDTCAVASACLLAGAATVATGTLLRPQLLHDAVMGPILIAFFAILASTILWVVVPALTAMYFRTSRQISEVLRELDNFLPSTPAAYLSGANTSDQFQIFAAVANTARLPYSTAATVQYGAAFVSTMIAFVLSFIR
jgi:hypothetical protein